MVLALVGKGVAGVAGVVGEVHEVVLGILSGVCPIDQVRLFFV